MPATITGSDALDYINHCTAGGFTINKYADPTEGDRLNITVDEANDIARKDASLIYVEVDEAKSFTYKRDLVAEVGEMMGPDGTPGDAELMVDALDAAGFIIRGDGEFVLLPTTTQDWFELIGAVVARA